jgi:hypothetical protein
MSRVMTNWIALGCALAAYAQNPLWFATKAKGADWTANGATACEKYLTPDVVAAILLKPDGGKSHPIDATSCIYQTEHAGSIGIILKTADIDVFRAELPRIAFAHPISGVGDAAFWNPGGGFSAVKGHSRGCDMSVLMVPYDTKIHEDALAQKLGEICNKLFALP